MKEDDNINRLDQVMKSMGNNMEMLGNLKLSLAPLKIDGGVIEHDRHLLPSPIAIHEIKYAWNNFGKVRDSKKGWYAHLGIDLTAKSGTNIYAIARSKVVKIQYSKRGWGNRVYLRIIDGPYKGHNYCYCHVSWINPNLKKNSIVDISDVVAQVGASGNVTGAHLHFMFGTCISRWPGYKTNSNDVLTIGFINGADVLDLDGVRWAA